jgi:Zn-dependent peptidase ImmA (M78 family)
VLTFASIRAAAETFWAGAGGRSIYGSPPDLESATTRSLPLAVHRVPGLTNEHVSQLITAIDGQQVHSGSVRALRGCLIADVGVGLIVLDSEDSFEEQRVTFAHELAHFLLHYQAPRQLAIKAFGPAIISVLDRTRMPTRSELLSAALRDVSIEPYRHAMRRNYGKPTGLAVIIEAEADDLAIELLAPRDAIRALRPPTPTAIADQFGLPLPVASRLALTAAPSSTTMGVASIFDPP